MNPASRVRSLEAFVQQDPDNWNLRADLFDAALAAGDTAVASAQLEYARLGRAGDAAWKHREATLLLASKRYAEAQGVLEGLLATGVDQSAVRHNLGFALFAQGRYEAARDAVTPLLEGKDESAGAAWVLWLRCMHRLHALDDALLAFARRPGHVPVPPDAFGVASLIAVDATRLDDARTLAQLALRGRKDQLEALATQGTLALAQQDATSAQGYFETALRVNGGDGRSWSGLAFARMLKTELPAALQAFEKAVAGMPDHIGTWIGYGWCQFLAKQPQAALGSFDRALALDRNFAESHGARAVALAQLGQKDEARREIELALRLDRMSLSARYAEALLGGEAQDAQAFLRFTQRVLSRVPVAGLGGQNQTLADAVFKKQV